MSPGILGQNPAEPDLKQGRSKRFDPGPRYCSLRPVRLLPAALETQTAGSVIRPASVCGVFGFKPTFGRSSLEGVHPLAPSLDTLGVFTRALEDVPLLLAALGLPLDDAPLLRPPRIGLWRTELWGLATPTAQHCAVGAARALAAAGAMVRDVELAVEGSLAEAQATVMGVEAVSSLSHLRAAHGEALNSKLRKLSTRGRPRRPRSTVPPLPWRRRDGGARPRPSLASTCC